MPEPNGPGTQAVPPLASGKKVSTTRCPVTSGVSGLTLRRYGRPMRTGQRCARRSSWVVPSSSVSVPITSLTVNEPERRPLSVPDMPGGTMIQCLTISVS